MQTSSSGLNFVNMEKILNANKIVYPPPTKKDLYLYCLMFEKKYNDKSYYQFINISK